MLQFFDPSCKGQLSLAGCKLGIASDGNHMYPVENMIRAEQDSFLAIFKSFMFITNYNIGY